MKLAAIALTLVAAIMPQNAQDRVKQTKPEPVVVCTGDFVPDDCLMSVFSAATFIQPQVGTDVAVTIPADAFTRSPVRVEAQQGRVDRLTEPEYAKLQKLRQAVKDEETAIAKAHGVDTVGQEPCLPYTYAVNYPCLSLPYIAPDVYEYRGQFLLINVPNTKP